MPDDPERGLEMFRQKLKEAGIEKIVRRNSNTA